ncbi:MAG TPA: M28 family peptidase [Candidatus Eisenbacteria bacterium]|jgi:hypothetical protein
MHERPSETSAPSALVDRLRAHVEHLAGVVGERHLFRHGTLDAARAYIEAEWERQGYRAALQWFEVMGHRCANVEAERTGRASPGRILLIGAHYDTVPGSPGANDNASGVAALLEISRLFAGRTPRLTVRFVAFANEERPFFGSDGQGSAVCARAARLRGDDVLLMASLETIGCYRDEPHSQRHPPLFGLFYPHRGNFVAFVSDLRSRRRMHEAAAVFRAASNFPLEEVATFRFVPGVGWSDHRAFWECGYRAFMVTDTAFCRYPHYHTARDTPDRLNYGPLARVTEALFHTFAALCEGDEGAAERR